MIKKDVSLKLAILCMVSLMSFSMDGFGQGTTCANATPIAINGLCLSGTISDPNIDGPALSCAGPASREGWYTFTVSGGPQNIIISAQSLNRNLAIQLLSSGASPCTTIAQIACANATNSASSSRQNEVIATSLSNGVYYLKVVNVSPTFTGDMTLTSLCITTNNDNCSGAIALVVNPTEVCTTSSIGTTLGASQSIPAINCGRSGNADDDVWYSFVAISDTHDVTVNSRTLDDAVIDVRAGDCMASTTIACADNTRNARPEIVSLTGLTIGNTYNVRVYSFAGNGNQGSFDICVTTPEKKVPALGSNSYTTCSGTLYDSGGSAGNYANNSTGYTVLNPLIPGNFVEVSGAITSESGYDYLTVYNGVGTGGTILWGGFPQGSGTACGTFTVPTITSLTGSLTVSFNSDFSNNCSGFALNIACSSTPGTPIYCEPTSQEPYFVYIDDVRFMGTLNDVDNLNSGYSNGYQDHTARPKAVQAQGEGMNIFYYNESYSGGAHVKAWVDWNKDADFSDLGELVYDTGTISTPSATFGVIIPIATPPGDYRIRIRNNENNFFGGIFSYDFDSCEDFNYTLFNDYDGEAEDYVFTVIPACNANIVTVTNGDNCGAGTTDLSVTGSAAATGFRWYSAETGGTLLYDDTLATGAWTTPSISSTTTYWVTAYNSACESYFRTPVTAKINPTPTVLFTPANPIVCGEDAIQITAGGDVEEVVLMNENFEGGGLGLFTNNNGNPNGNPYDPITVWQNKTSPYIPSDTEVWLPAISSGLAGNRFVMSTSDVNPPGNVYQYLELTSSVDASNMTNMKLTFDMYYSKFSDQVLIQANDGTGWNTIYTYATSVAIGTRFENQSINLPASYNGSSTLRVRIQFLSGWGDGVAIDNIRLFGIRTLSTSFIYDTTTVDAYTDASAVTPYEYVLGTPAAAIWIKPTLAQLENSSFTIPVTAVLSNGCTANGSVNVTNNTKIFKGSSLTDWNNPSYWSPSLTVPTADNCVVIPSSFTSIIDGTTNANAKNVTVKNGGTLRIEPQGSLTIVNFSKVEATGKFVIENSGSLIQIDNVANTGNIQMQRLANNMTSQSYVYWSSPVNNFAVTAVSPGSSLIYKWIPTIATNGVGHYGNWQATTEIMESGKGYIIRGISNTNPDGVAALNTVEFTGVPRNGIIQIPISHGNYNGGTYDGAGNTQATRLDDNWNLIGNPYPSAISANAFITQNASLISNDVDPLIAGTVYLWKHEIAPSTTADPFYGDYVYNYNPNDYLAYNNTGSNPSGFNGNIAAGQSFFVLMDDIAPTPSNVTFNNSMRLDSSSNPLDNTNFYRTAENNELEENRSGLERHRIWLDLIAPNKRANSILVGYVENATNGIDRLYDGYDLSETGTKFYSLIGDEKMSIQGKALPFDDTDLVPLGLLIPQTGNYTIAINSVDGLFENPSQYIFLEDTYTNIIFDLRIAPYSFNSESGTFNDRFILRYTNETLSTPEQVANFGFNIIGLNDYIKVTSGTSPINTVVVYDVLGRVLADYKDINDLEFKLDLVNQSKGTLIVKATLYNGQQKIKKVIY